MKQKFTGCLVPGISTVMNCPKLYSRSADLTPVCRASSSEMMLRTSTIHQPFTSINQNAIVPLRTSLISPGGACRRNFEAMSTLSDMFIAEGQTQEINKLLNDVLAWTSGVCRTRASNLRPPQAASHHLLFIEYPNGVRAFRVNVHA